MEQKNRTTSAGYRFPIRSAPRSSEFHQTCIPPEKRAAAAQTSSEGRRDVDNVAGDVVAQDKMWRQSVDNEKQNAKKWEQNWGFLAEVDPKGRAKTPVQLPDKVNMFSDDLPNTNAGEYGARLSTDTGLTMQQLEFRFHSGNRKKKMENDLVCY